MLDTIALMNGLTQKMGFLQARQRVLAENVSNSDTPGFQARDIKAPDFASALGQAQKQQSAGGQQLQLAATEVGHINYIGGDKEAEFHPEKVRKTYEVSPENNSVSLEESLMKSSQNAIDYQLVTNIYNKNLDMLRMAIRG
jgi:flagellar basal-body rod protein FlgB